MGEIKYLVVHCSATPPKRDIGAAEIDRWHREKGWRCIGYHFVIRRNGEVEKGRPTDEAGAHVEGYNAVSLGICMVGGVNAKFVSEDNFTPAQKNALARLLEEMLIKFPRAQIVGHRDLNPHKDCPSFDAKAWWSDLHA